MSVTRKQLRRDVFRELGDILILTATAAGTDVTFIDQKNLTGGTDAYAGRYILFSDGTAGNIGEERYVTGSSRAQRAIGWGVPLPDDVADGDECEMINTRGVGFRFQDFNESLDIVMRSIGDDGLIPATSDDQAFSYGTGLEIPETWRRVEQVKRLDTYDEFRWHFIPKAKNPHGNGWWVDQSTRELMVTGQIGARNDGRTVKMWGSERPSMLVADDDETDVDYLWLISAIKARMALQRSIRMPMPEYERLVYIMNQEAERLRPRMVTRHSSQAEWLA